MHQRSCGPVACRQSTIKASRKARAATHPPAAPRTASNRRCHHRRIGRTANTNAPRGGSTESDRGEDEQGLKHALEAARQEGCPTEAEANQPKNSPKPIRRADVRAREARLAGNAPPPRHPSLHWRRAPTPHHRQRPPASSSLYSHVGAVHFELGNCLTATYPRRGAHRNTGRNLVSRITRIVIAGSIAMTAAFSAVGRCRVLGPRVGGVLGGSGQHEDHRPSMLRHRTGRPLAPSLGCWRRSRSSRSRPLEVTSSAVS